MIQDELEQLGNDRTNLLSKVHPDLIQISIKGFKNNQEVKRLQCVSILELNYIKSIYCYLQASKEEEIITGAKQIPVISDIERIKKVVEILEFVGEKVGVILENLQSAPQTSSDYEPEKKIVEDIVPVTTAY